MMEINSDMMEIDSNMMEINSNMMKRNTSHRVLARNDSLQSVDARQVVSVHVDTLLG